MSKQRASDDAFHFAGFQLPTYTIVPDELFDQLLVWLSGAELKVLLYIIRRTYGFKKDADSISISQMLNGITKDDGERLDYGAGLSKPTLLQALRSLQEKGIISTERRRSARRGDEPTVYRLRFASEARGQKFIPPVVKKFDQGGGKETTPPGWSKNLPTQETDRQETVLQQTDQTSTMDHALDHSIAGQAHENVENSDRTAVKDKGGRPHGRRPSSAADNPSPRSSTDGALAPVADPTGGRFPRRRGQAHPDASTQGSGGDDLGKAGNPLLAVSASTAISERDPAAPGTARRRRRPQAVVAKAGEERAEQASPAWLTSIGQVLASRGALHHDAPPVEGPKNGRIAAEGSRGLDHPQKASESRPGAITGHSREGFASRGRLPKADYIRNVISDFSRQLHDEDHERANVSRAIRLWQATNLDEPGFVSALYHARSITQKQPGVKKRSAAGGLINRMPYFFAVVEQLVGLKERPRSEREAAS